MNTAVGHYLIDNPPRIKQYRRYRRATPSGVVLLHSTESLADVKPPDTGAEDVARFIRDRTTYGSYHRLCDADSTVRLLPFWYEAFHDGTGTNRHSVGISGAFQAHQWRDLGRDYQHGVLYQMASAAAEYDRWLRAQHARRVVPRRITVAQARAGVSGFATHGMMDPSRRSDPDGTNTGDRFPWDRFFGYYNEITNGGANEPQEEDEMSTSMAWFDPEDGTDERHCHLISGNVATHMPTHEAINLAEYLGVPWAGGTQSKSILGKDWWMPLAIMTGPMANVGVAS